MHNIENIHVHVKFDVKVATNLYGIHSTMGVPSCAAEGNVQVVTHTTSVLLCDCMIGILYCLYLHFHYINDRHTLFRPNYLSVFMGCTDRGVWSIIISHSYKVSCTPIF